MSHARLALPPGRAMLPACCCAVADDDAGGRRRDFLARRDARVVAVEAAVDVAGAPEVVVRVALAERELHRVVLALRQRHRLAERRGARRELELGQALTGVADDVGLVALSVQRADVLDRPSEVVVDVVRAEDHVGADLVLQADAGAVLEHRLDVRVGRLEVRDAAVAEAARHGPQVGARHVRQVQGADVRRFEPAVVDLPGVATVGAARQLVPGPVVVAAPAAVQLELAVAAHVVGGAEARRDLVAPAEGHGVDAFAEGRHGLVLERAGRRSGSGDRRASTDPGRRARGCSRPPRPGRRGC